jgi:hypothetical protein
MPPDATLGDFVRKVSYDNAILMTFAMESARYELPWLQLYRASILNPFEDLGVVGTAETGLTEKRLMRAQPDGIDLGR